MKPAIPVDLNFVVEAVRLPGVRPVRNRNGLTEPVQLQTATTDGVHDGRIVHHLKSDALLLGPDDEVRVRCGAERITHHQQSNVHVICSGQNLVGTLLNEIAIGQQ